MIVSTEFIVVRHGETIWNTQKRLQGHQDSPLTPLGLQQADAVAERLTTEKFDALYSSDLPRAIRTAETIAKRIAHTILPDPRLRERNYGLFEGLTTVEIAERFPKDYQRFLARERDYQIPSGESLADKYRRVIACIEDLASRHPEQRVIIVTHGGVLSDLLRWALDIPMDRPLHFKLYNASLNTFFSEDGRWLLGTWGEIGHLRHIISAKAGTQAKA